MVSGSDCTEWLLGTDSCRLELELDNIETVVVGGGGGTEDTEAEEGCNIEADEPWEHLEYMEMRMYAGCLICR